MNSRQLSVEIPPRWDGLSDIRRRTETFLSGLGLPRDAVDAVSMVVCELGENAIKYGASRDEQKDDPGQVRFQITASDQEVVVQVQNHIGQGNSDHLDRLDRTVQWIRGYQDPFEAYLQRLKELSSEALDSHESRLGLVRIAYEGQAVLDFYVDEQDVLSVSAIRRLG